MKKVLSLVVVFLMVFSSMAVTAFGATSYSDINVAISDGYSASLTLTAEGASGSHQVTMLAVKQGESADVDTNIKYIDQISYSEFPHSFTLGNNVTPGIYTLKVGGTNMSTPASKDFETKVAAPAIAAKAGNPTTINRADAALFTFTLSGNDAATFADGINKNGADNVAKKAFVTINSNDYVVPATVAGNEVTVNLGNGALNSVSGDSATFTLSVESVGFKNAVSEAITVTLSGGGEDNLVVVTNKDLSGNDIVNPFNINGGTIVTVTLPVGFDINTNHVTVKGTPAYYSPARNKFIAVVTGNVSESDINIASGAVNDSNKLYYGILVTEVDHNEANPELIPPEIDDVMEVLNIINNPMDESYTFMQKLAADVNGNGKVDSSEFFTVLNKHFNRTRTFDIEKH